MSKSKKPTSGASAPIAGELKETITSILVSAAADIAREVDRICLLPGGAPTAEVAAISGAVQRSVEWLRKSYPEGAKALLDAAPAPPAARKPRRGRKRASGTRHKHAPCGIVGCEYCRPELRRSGTYSGG